MQKTNLSICVEGTTTDVGIVVSSEKQKTTIVQLADHQFFIHGGFSAKTPYDGGKALPFVLQDAMPDAWGMALTKHRLKRAGIKRPSFSDVIMMIGANGAWRFTPHYQSPQTDIDNIINWQETVEQTHRILKGIEVKDAFQWLVGSAGLGGARPKFLVDIKGGSVVRYGANPNDGQWIVKLPSPVDPPNIGASEFHYNRLARECGIDVSDFELIDNTYFATKRFDFNDQGNLYTRTLSGLNQLNHSDSMGNSYESVINWSMRLFGQNNAHEVLKLALFNRLVGNCDDHAKNISFLCNAQGEWSLAPAYDLTPNVGLGTQAMSLNGTTSPELDDYKEVADKFGVRDSFIDDVAYRLRHLDGLGQFEQELIRENLGELGLAVSTADTELTTKAG